MSTKDRIILRLTETFNPIRLDVIDESDQHAGHVGVHDGRTETHFRVRIAASAFASKSRLQQHRMINEALADELAAGVHALAIEATAA
jgi:BolA family transcriptional regulator, general stress-responsive regulator